MSLWKKNKGSFDFNFVGNDLDPDLACIIMILKREIGIGQLTDVQTSEIDYITRMKAMPFDLYSKKVRAHDQSNYQTSSS